VLSSRSEHLGVARVPDRAKPSDCDTVAYIPARLASERVPRKNLRLLGDYPLISYVSKAALRASSIDRVYVNTESSEIAAAAKTIGVEVYWRAARLAAGPVTTDEILYDFAKAIDCRTLVVINPTAPFLKPETIDRVLSRFRNSPSDTTLFTTTVLRKHFVMGGQPCNFSFCARSPRTQDLTALEYINFIMLVVPRAKAITQYERSGYCLYIPPLVFFPMSGIECLDIDEEDDFVLAETINALNKSECAEGQSRPTTRS
jgi:CMP-N-acetylneuraminic acid synthetase